MSRRGHAFVSRASRSRARVCVACTCVFVVCACPLAARSYSDTWPSQFVGAANTTTRLHVDSAGTSFWMALLRGRKRFVFFDREHVPALYPDAAHSVRPRRAPACGTERDLRSHFGHSLRVVQTFGVDAGDVLAGDAAFHSAHPAAAHAAASAHVAELGPGDILFVPAGSPHQVFNVGDDATVAVSGNFVEPANLAVALDEMRRLAPVAPGAAAALTDLDSPELDTTVVSRLCMGCSLRHAHAHNAVCAWLWAVRLWRRDRSAVGAAQEQPHAVPAGGRHCNARGGARHRVATGAERRGRRVGRASSLLRSCASRHLAYTRACVCVRMCACVLCRPTIVPCASTSSRGCSRVSCVVRRSAAPLRSSLST